MDITGYKLSFFPIQDDDGPEVIEIFNYYILHSDAAFPQEPVPEAFFHVMRSLIGRYPTITVRNEAGTLVGFGMLKPHNPLPAFRHTAEITYFIRPEWTGKGIGGMMLEYLLREGKLTGLSCILAEISSNNELSLKFHHNSGFSECGRFRNAGIKNGRFFDTVWMQMEI
jgi:phosphinothricin acetyltransferase